MKNAIRVECWADHYFFGRLMAEKSLLRKEKNKSEVFKSIKVRGRGIFSICIVDNDGDKVEPFLGALQIEQRFFICDQIEIIKIKDNPYFILQLFPKEFEKWIESYITEYCGLTLEDFGYSSYKEFEVDSKVIPERLASSDRFLTLINYVLNNCDKTENHISTIKKVLRYLVVHTYEADMNELRHA